MVKTYKPAIEDLWFREELLSDEDTMAYNHRWGGAIEFPKKDWCDWYDYWLVNTDGKRNYWFLMNEDNEFIGEIAYHYDGKYNLADIIIHSKYRHRGYGRDGLNMLCSLAKQEGIEELYDDIAIDNPAIKLFLNNGFTEIYRTEDIIMLKKIL